MQNSTETRNGYGCINRVIQNPPGSGYSFPGVLYPDPVFFTAFDPDSVFWKVVSVFRIWFYGELDPDPFFLTAGSGLFKRLDPDQDLF